MIKFIKQVLINQKSQIKHSSKITQKPWDYAWKWEKQCKRRGNIDIPAYRERNLARNLKENDKKFFVEPCWVGERERGLKSLKKTFEKDRIHVLKNLIHDIRLIEKQVQSIEPDRGSLKFLKRILIDRKTDWINRKSGKTSF